MAVIQYSAVVNQLRGKLNGSVFNKSSTGYTLTSKGQPPRTITHEQSISRARFQQAQRRWKELSAQEQADWALFASNNPNRDRFGNETILSGYNKYMECTINAESIGSFISYPINTNPVPPAPFDSLSITGLELQTFSSGNQIFVLHADVRNPISANKFYSFEVGLPMSAGVTNYTKSYRFMGFVQAFGAGTTVTISGRTFPASWNYKEGDRVAVRLRYYVPFRGVIGYETISYVTLGNIPAITSFSSNSYSPTPPRTYTIGLFNKDMIDGINYRFECRAPASMVGSCPISPSDAPISPLATDALFDTGTFTSGYTVSAGTCQLVEARIVHIPTDTIVSLRYFHINNL